MRLDIVMTQRGLAGSMKVAQAMIMAGQVRVGERVQSSEFRVQNKDKEQRHGSTFKIISKAGTLVTGDCEIFVEQLPRYVSRGGEKLEGALNDFNFSAAGKTCIDVGASTGGFTDCLLQSGAVKVYAVDVGYGKLHPKLRADNRVINLEKTHILKLPPGIFNVRPDLAVIDASFISLTRILPAVIELVKKEGDIFALIKPQFELSARETPGGVVRDEESRQKALQKVIDSVSPHAFNISDPIRSKLTGRMGNVEYWIHIKCK